MAKATGKVEGKASSPAQNLEKDTGTFAQFVDTLGFADAAHLYSYFREWVARRLFSSTCRVPESYVEIVEREAVFLTTLEEAAEHVRETLHLHEQARAQLAEVDEIIQRLGRDRKEIDRLKKETRSNISELQRMIAA